MLIKAKCEHCQAEFEDEGMNKTVWCASCGKETHILAKGSDYSFRTEAADDIGSAIVWGYVMAFVFPLAGFFIGIYLMAKKQAGHGAAAMFLSVFVGSALWWLLLAMLFAVLRP
jgi:DNA-directed RNA polymerase subunit RPC12/RpoP